MRCALRIVGACLLVGLPARIALPADVDGVRAAQTSESFEQMAAAKARAREAAAKAAEAAERAKEQILQARIAARTEAVSKQFPKLRMVIGGLSAAINGYIRPQGLLVDGQAWPSTYPAMTLDFTRTAGSGRS